MSAERIPKPEQERRIRELIVQAALYSAFAVAMIGWLCALGWVALTLLRWLSS